MDDVIQPFALTCAAVIGFILMVAAVAKVLNLSEIQQTIRQLAHVSERSTVGIRCFSYAIVASELLVGTSILMGSAAGRFAGLLLMICFLAVACYAVAYKIRASCSCFGASGAFTKWTIYRNLAFVVISAVSASSVARPFTMADVLHGAIALVLSLCIRRLWENATAIRQLRLVGAI